MNSIERHQRREAIRRQAEARSRKLKQEGRGNSTRERDALGLIDVIVDRLIEVESEVAKVKRNQRGR